MCLSNYQQTAWWFALKNEHGFFLRSICWTIIKTLVSFPNKNTYQGWVLTLVGYFWLSVCEFQGQGQITSPVPNRVNKQVITGKMCQIKTPIATHLLRRSIYCSLTARNCLYLQQFIPATKRKYKLQCITICNGQVFSNIVSNWLVATTANQSETILKNISPLLRVLMGIFRRTGRKWLHNHSPSKIQFNSSLWITLAVRHSLQSKTRRSYQ